MKYLVDSDVLVAYLKGRQDAVTLLQQLFSEGLAISATTFGEIAEGIYYGTDSKQHEAAFRRLLRGLTVLSVNRQVAARFAQLRGELRQQGQLIPDADLLIASTALRHTLVLVTRNRQHFERIRGLQLYDESAPGAGQR
jgi:tRNA(fMet)-specific endonuclease VapC